MNIRREIDTCKSRLVASRMLSSTIQPFVYAPLQNPSQEIRLLRLLDHGDGHETNSSNTIHCHLSTSRIEDSPRYIAISYTWGDPVDPATILLNGKSYEVRQSCRYVLEQAIRHGVSDYLWIDAICIDQASHYEKSSQVAMMGMIYRNAQQVHVCVGPEADDSAFFLSVVQEHSHHVSEAIGRAQRSGALNEILTRTKQGGKIDQWSTHPGEKFSRTSRPLLLAELETQMLLSQYSVRETKRIVDAAFAFSERIYFSRLWIVQELLLGRETIVRCGDSSIYFQSLQDFDSDLVAYHSQKRTGIEVRQGRRYSDLASIWNSWTNEGMDFQELTDQFAQFGCSDVRDRIYGVLALVDWQGYDVIYPDYNKSAFSLACQCIWYVAPTEANDPGESSVGRWPLLSATRLAVALDVHSGVPEIQGLLESRRLSSQEGLFSVFTKPSHARERVIIAANSYCQIFAKSETSTALFACFGERSSSLEMENAPRSLEVERGDTWTDVAHGDIYDTRGSRAARVVEASKAGDWIIAFDSFNFGLVVRKSADGDDRCAIVGQAIFEDGVSICSGGTSCACSSDENQHAPHNTMMEVHFDPVDLLLFCCQSLAKDNSMMTRGAEKDGDNTYRREVVESSELQRLRLTTSVVLKGEELSSFARMKETQRREDSQTENMATQEKLLALMSHFHKHNT